VVAGLVAVGVGLAGSAIAVMAVPGRGAVYAAAAPLLLAGLGSGLVISPNQTLTLGDVPQHQAGSAGGVVQTAQRVGAAFGVAIAGGVFFGAVPQGYPAAYERAVWVCVAFVAAALVIAVVDVVTNRRRARAEAAAVAT
jgi:uncharacterized protein (DUF58 family)